MTSEDSIKSEISIYMWHIGNFLTDMMYISDSTSSPIIVQTFQAGAHLFDVLGEYVYGSLSYKNIFPNLEEFIISLDYESDTNFKPALQYAHDLCQDLLAFLNENNLK
ncbi:MAG: hypothetical protein ACFFAO_17440 [Candidatus Hermodarchaeota archaeon]